MNVNNVAILVQKKTLRPRVRYGIRKAVFLKVRQAKLSLSTLLDGILGVICVK